MTSVGRCRARRKGAAVSVDTEKRWHDPREFRRASLYTAVVIAVAAVVAVGSLLSGGSQAEQCQDAAFRVCRDPERLVLAVGPPTVLLVGGLGAFGRTFRVWRAGGVWPIWQGAGWLLLALMLVYFTASSGVVVGG